MKQHLLRIVFGIGLVAVASATGLSQQKTGTDAADFLGSVDKNVYRNGYFGFELAVPRDWKMLDQETSGAAMRVGADVLKGKNEKSNKALQDSITKEVVLLHVTKKPMGAPDNAMFMMAVMKQPSVHVTPSMVAEATKSLFADSPIAKVTKDTWIDTIAGKRFARLDYVLNVQGQAITVRYYVTVLRGFAVSFSLSHLDEEDSAELSKIVESIRFTRK